MGKDNQVKDYNPLVSIVVPIYNLEHYVPKCLESLLEQTYANLQIILVDDGSSDGSWNVIQSYASKDTRMVAVHQENGGAARARNNGISRIEGELMMFVDGDDILSKNTIELLVPYFQNVSLEWVEFPVVRTDSKGEKLKGVKDFIGFVPTETVSVDAKNIMNRLASGRLSELCCGCLYRVSFAKDIRFPEGEFYEDSFYFTDVVYKTQCGMVVTEGEYRYVERDGSSQLSVLDEKRIYSKVHCILERIAKFSAMEYTEENFLRKIENDAYYYYKTLIAKGNFNARKPLQEFLEHKKYPTVFNLLTEIKIFIYKLLGYQRIKRVLTKLR